MMLKTDCRHFPGSRPCRFNKETGQTCPACPHYRAKGKRILITKLDALGDVLRTTALLPGLKDQYPDSYIVWITRAGAADLFKHNPFVDELWIADAEALSRLQVESFDIVINPDADKWTAALATAAKAQERLGMMLDSQGNVIPATSEAVEWLEMGAFDHLKKANQKSYQQIVYEMSRLTYKRQKPVLCLTNAECAWGIEFLENNGRMPARKLIGLNLGGGGRWKHKRWTSEHIATFCEMVLAIPNLQLMVIGGLFERDLMKNLQAKFSKQIIFSGSDRTLRELASLVAACNVLVTGDTLVLHLATAMGTPVVVPIGPTSASEIELYERGVYVISGVDCRCCYLQHCDRVPTCMDLIMPHVIISHVLELIGGVGPSM